jgi:hypothetical protein
MSGKKGITNNSRYLFPFFIPFLLGRNSFSLVLGSKGKTQGEITINFCGSCG